MRRLIKKHSLSEIGEPENLFLELVDIITSQQLSVKAGRTIFNRLLSLLSPKTPPEVVPQDLLNLSHEQLRSAGLSNSKVTYVHHLADTLNKNHIILEHLKNFSDIEIIDQITQVKGLGPWSAEMFLIFSLRRPDVFSVGDLGLRTAISNLYGIDREDKKRIEKLSQTWSPHRSFASRYLWASLNNS